MEEILQQLESKLAKGTANLPSLPQLVLRIRAVVDNPQSDASAVARAVTADPALTAKLLRMANSVAFFRGGKKVDSVNTAVVRLGHTLVRDMVTCLVVQQLFRAEPAAAIRDHLARVWRHSVRVAAISFVLAKRCTKLAPEKAMLAGLVHDVGNLYLLEFLFDEVPELFVDGNPIPRMIANQHPHIGARILEHWEMDEEIVTAAAEHRNLGRTTDRKLPDLADVVIIANLHSFIGTQENPYGKVNWGRVPSLAKLGLDPKSSIEVLRDAIEEIRAVESLLKNAAT